MNKRWGSLLVIAGVALFPIAMQSGVSGLKTYVSGNPHLQVRTQSRTIGNLEFCRENEVTAVK